MITKEHEQEPEELTQWREDGHQKKAIKEGWDIFECIGSNNGRYQVQRLDEEAILEEDIDAWKLITNSNQPHHLKTLEIIEAINPEEHQRIKTTNTKKP